MRDAALQAEIALIGDLLNASDWSAAYAKAVAATNVYTDAPELQRLAAQACHSGVLENQLQHLEAAHRLDPANPRYGRDFAKRLVHSNNKPAAFEVIKKYFPKNDPAFVPLPFEVELVASFSTARSTIDQIVAEAMGTNQTISPWIVNLIAKSLPPADALVAMGRLPESDLHPRAVERRNMLVDTLTRIQTQIEKMEPVQYERVAREAEEIKNRDIECEHIVFTRGSPRTLLIITGLGGITQGIPLEASHWLNGAADANIVYILNRQFSATGPFGFIDERGLTNLRRLLDNLDTQTLVTLGYSAGTFAAIRYGTRLRAHRCICFGPITALDSTVAETDKRLAAIINSELKFLVQPTLDCDIQSSPQTLIDLHYGAGCALDKLHASFIQRHENVHEHAHAGFDQHNVFMHLVRTGVYPGIIASVFDCRNQ